MIFDVDDMYEIEEDYKAKLEKKDKEIERLNNIINELEKKMLNDKLNYENSFNGLEDDEIKKKYPYCLGSYHTNCNLYAMISQLKGDDK